MRRNALAPSVYRDGRWWVCDPWGTSRKPSPPDLVRVHRTWQAALEDAQHVMALRVVELWRLHGGQPVRLAAQASEFYFDEDPPRA